MTTLPDRTATALLVVDVQNDVVAGAVQRETVLANIAGLVRRARSEGVPVVWVQQTDENFVRGSEGWAIVPDLDPSDEEPHIEKVYGDSFESTDLESVLSKLSVGRLLVTGAQTDQCVRATLHSALVRGYDTVLVSDAHTTEDNTEYGAPSPELVIAHTNLYWTYEEAPGRTAGTVTAAEVDFSAPIAAR